MFLRILCWFFSPSIARTSRVEQLDRLYSGVEPDRIALKTDLILDSCWNWWEPIWFSVLSKESLGNRTEFGTNFIKPRTSSFSFGIFFLSFSFSRFSSTSFRHFTTLSLSLATHPPPRLVVACRCLFESRNNSSFLTHPRFLTCPHSFNPRNLRTTIIER